MAEYIKREDAIEAFYTATGDGDKADWAVGAIKSIPAADVAPVRHGVWIPTPCPGIENAYLVVCSKCKAEIYVSNDFNPSNFCPNCGADMRELK